MILPVSLTSCAAAALIAMWLMLRVSKLRIDFNILHGDGGNEALIRRMRAQANFVENTPFVLLLIAGIELAGHGGHWLSIVAGIYLLARVAHAIGMDSPEGNKLRSGGVAITMFTLLGLAVYAVLIAAGVV